MPNQYTKTLAISTLTASSQAPTPAGYTKTANSSDAIIASSQLYNAYSGNRFCLWVDNTQLLNDVVISTVKLGQIVANSLKDCGATITNLAGAGYYVAVRDTTNDLRIFALSTGGDISGTALYTVASTYVDLDKISLSYSTSTGVIKLLKNGVQVGVDFAGTANNNYRYGGMRTHAGKLRELTVEYTQSQSITAINTGAPVTYGQTSVPVAVSGFSAKPTTATVTYTGGTVGITIGAGDKDNFVCNIADRVDGGAYPVDGADVTFTFNNGSETATLITTISKKTDDVKITLNSIVQNDSKYITSHFVTDGYNPEGAEFIYTPYSNLTISTSGAPTVATAGTFTGWLRPVTGQGAFNVFRYDFTIPSSSTVADLTSLGVNSTSPKYDGAYPLGNRP